MPPPAAILDVDGTLVDTNYHHAIAWYRAFRASGLVLPLWRIHRHIGMGGDQLVGALGGERFDSECGDAVREREKDEYMQLIDEVELFEGARDLIESLKARGHAVVLASSAKAEEVDHYLDLLDARELADDWTSSADVERTKPHPDLVKAALEKIGAVHGVMIGDTPWDVKAAAGLDVPCIAVRTGGFGEDELRAAGAVEVFESIVELTASLERTPLGAAA